MHLVLRRDIVLCQSILTVLCTDKAAHEQSDSDSLLAEKMSAIMVTKTHLLQEEDTTTLAHWYVWSRNMDEC